MQLMSEKIADKMKKLAEKRSKIGQRERLLKEKARKQEVRRFIEIGAIAARFGIDSFDNDTLAGIFAEIQEKAKQPEATDIWRKKGHTLSQKTLQPLIISFEKEPADELKSTLKAMKFKWISFRKEWHGHGIKNELEDLTKEFKGTVETVNG